MTLKAVDPKAWATIVLAVWAALASLGIAGYAVWQARTEGNLRVAQADLDEAERVNESMRTTLDEIRTDLATCEDEFDRAKTREAEDLIAHTNEVQALEARLQETRNDIADALHDEADADPELERCLSLSVPGPAYGRLSEAAARAAGAHRGGAAGVDPDSAAPDRPAGSAGPAGHP